MVALNIFRTGSLLLTLISSLAPTLASPELNAFARDVSRVEAIRDVKDLQRSLTHLAQFGKWSDISQLFTPSGKLQWGNATATGRSAVEAWFKSDAGNMDGIKPGSLHAMIAESPMVNLAVDGKSAKARWNGMRFMGDGKGSTRIEGGVYENEYVLEGGAWKISLLRYYALFKGPYVGGWRNVKENLPLVPHHTSANDTGLPVPPAVGEAPETEATIEDLAERVRRMNDEDDVRNLQHAYGYYVDRRMWSDVVDLFVDDAKVMRLGRNHTGKRGVREAMEAMGPEGLTFGILNDHAIFNTMVHIEAGGKSAIARGLELGMIGDVKAKTSSWEFTVFRNRFVKDNGVWKLAELILTPLIVANYSSGWGNGGTLKPNTATPEFLPVPVRSAVKSKNIIGLYVADVLAELQRLLRRAAAFDGTENVSSAYSFYADDMPHTCDALATIHAANGHKLSPFAGFFKTPARISQACKVVWGGSTGSSPTSPTNPERSSVSFHWRPQPVILVSEDGRSATLRARLFQPSTSNKEPDGLRSAMYQDQAVLENGRWRLWSVTIDEFYWQSNGWSKGWAGVTASNGIGGSSGPSSWTEKYKPDLFLSEVGEREITFGGGGGKPIQWPDIQRMWFPYRNLVSGRKPEWYWPGCVPCQVKKDWSLEANGWQEPPTGPL